ncbi:MAG: leucine-rich repeat domain-containing protein, partial [Muribaculaceae bacterium]|nr:leucine-rich repeat domain-containing protein [Muribaculaceae bacterium]
SLGGSAFLGCSGLTALSLPSSVKTIGEGGFQECTGLTTLTLPEGIETLNNSSFLGCTGLTSLTLPASLTEITYHAFWNCSGLTEISYYAENPVSTEVIFDDTVYANAVLNMPNATLADIQAVSTWNQFAHIVAKDGSIDPGMYQIEFDRTEPASGTTVPSLGQISTWWTLPNTINITNDPVPYVTNEAGERMDRIEVRLAINERDPNNILIDISPEITANGTYQVVIPAGAITDGSNPDRFTNDEVILTYTVKKNLVAGDDFEYQGLKYTVLDAEARTCETKEGTETTPGNSFEGDLVIPETVSDGTNEYSVTRVGIYGFKGCNNIRSLTLPISLTEIGEEAFMNCTGLTSLDLPRNITSIEGGAFDNCDGIVTVNLPEALVRIPDQCFHNCANLTTVSFPESLKEIATDAFLECNKLVNITLPNSLSTIESGAFNGCALGSLTLPASIANIRSLAFHGCPINIVNYEASKPVEAPSNIFDDVVYEDATLIMPNATLADIQAIEPWNKFVHIEAQDNEGSGSNLVVNGDFENPDYVQSVPGEYTYSPVDTWENLTELPGWTLSTSGPWNGVISLITDEYEIGKDLIRPLNGTNILLFRGYPDNGWTTLNAAQIVKGLVPGREYNIDFLIAENQPDGSWGPQEPNYGFTISEVDGDTEGKEILGYTYTEQNLDLKYYGYKFVAPNDGQVYLKFFLMNQYYEGNHKDDLWMALDNVRIYDGKADPITEPVAGDDFEYQGIIYTVLDAEAGTCETKAGEWAEPGNICSGQLVIPATVYNKLYDYTVVKVGSYGFGSENKHSDFTSVTLPETIEEIGAYGFNNCTELTEINLPNSLKIIANYSFVSTAITSLILPESLQSIEGFAFGGCRDLISISFPNTPIRIGTGAFETCTNLQNISFSQTLPEFPSVDQAFYQCTAIKDIKYTAATPTRSDLEFEESVYENAVLNMPNAALGDIQATAPWNKFAHIEAKDGSIPPQIVAGDKFTYQGIVYSILDTENRTCIAHAPDYEGEVPNVKDSNTIIPETVSDGTYDYTVIGIREFAFSGAENLLSVTLPSSIESIGEDAFANCPRLTSLVWKAHRRMQEDVVPSIDNPNLLVYVDSLKFAPVELNHNIVVMDTESGSPECQRLVIDPAYPFTPLYSFVSLNSSMTKEFSQTTPLGGCAGWETIVLPFDATSVALSDARGELTPFSRITNIETQYPYWLYEADSQGEWKEAFGIQAGIPYLISMPNNEQYAVRYRISGPVTFSNPNAVTITPQTTAPYS